MPRHLQREIENLKRKILALCAVVEERVQQAARSFGERNVKLAQMVIDSDAEIDRMEIEVEEECLKILALHQPVAVDLRFIVAVLKINSDLERIGDLAVNIAERALRAHGLPAPEVPADLSGMVEKAVAMLRKSLEALVNMDAQLARNVCAADDEVDAINRQMYEQVKAAIPGNPEGVDYFICLLSVSRQLERIADHATNIAEDIIYMIEGDIVRHRVKEGKPGRQCTN